MQHENNMKRPRRSYKKEQQEDLRNNDDLCVHYWLAIAENPAQATVTITPSRPQKPSLTDAKTSLQILALKFAEATLAQLQINSQDQEQARTLW